MKEVKINNNILLAFDVEAMIYVMETDRNLGDIHLLEFRNYLYKKYYKEEKEE